MGVFSLIAISIIILDQVFKNIIRNNVSENSFIDTVIPFLKIGYIKNAGAALGIFPGYRLLLVIFSVLAMLFLLYFVWNKKNRDLKFLIYAAFIVGGGVSNLIDRMFFGYVTDYLKIMFFPPICNLADYFISIGVFFIILGFIKMEFRK